ncbi:2-amino-4-hydroxy-6-hydroxymethyldihydropteridine diphosphokinase [Paracoccus sp. TK19116]|uniref:2-amino-4-hydroxy-6-hydroxymethyldihydropteridine pyrophosphokinase n=1 Tax=Paracoccus albicereus TaxID=2922394 RepID=A0ABT1MP60_9RHOB|nr:2-amino-4-hydroxy-6-hydroxymethyldihydropteridine diphosphokinase [Paracoccus albicereus]MCQ0970080.1 2-amino-4-hydroxy-6-hydroxymethyldihydropteridine diphosphokinase [Paracoccus albicereus]
MNGPQHALIALGSNLPSEQAGHPDVTLRVALRMLHAEDHLSIHAVSSFWTTPAHPAGSGPDYCNAAALVGTSLPPEALLDCLHRIEAALGRLRPKDAARWQSRPLDLDLIAIGDAVLPDEATHDHWRALPPARQAQAAPQTLILPHPRLQDRGFVLAPLAEIAPDWSHPRTGLTVAQMLTALPKDALLGMRRVAAVDRP